ncbi:hypothetical protein COU78_03175 [Candidatus Peregrinibacteria bacterium CG10_big_fil_rev_8_21_14_0_10_49_24]|nr:MAG: hypothetical protein COV83_04995 [Candidatus Peregrinibacteria bacterium CG11_big_fil_rev_8_21_14_0_20_49_14]PIR51127.1 MAG: hypothetical protein COU78_03175 [Candidatus Peregrinibacteria bacterium CG10_big_fil_rev_8_21_14_0_10_49_24]
MNEQGQDLASQNAHPADPAGAEMAETYLTSQRQTPTEKVASASRAHMQTSEAALERLRAVFKGVPGADDALSSLEIRESDSDDTDPVINEVVNRLMTLPVIEKIVHGNRAQVERTVGHAMNGGMRSVGGTTLNMSVLSDPPNERFGLLTPIGSGAFGYVADVALAEDLIPEDEDDPYGHPSYAVKMLIDTGVDQKIFERFWSERTTLGAIRGGAPQVYADGMSNGRPYFIMRNIRGMNFREVLTSINSALQHDAGTKHFVPKSEREIVGTLPALGVAEDEVVQEQEQKAVQEPLANEAQNQPVLWPSQWMHLSLASICQTMSEIHYPKGATEVVTDDARLSQLTASDETADFKKRPVGVVHRDLKPENVSVDEEGRVWILDFGLVRSMGEGERDGLTMTGQVMGTPHYMAPEYINDSKRNTSTKTDVYALGCMAFQMLTGIRPFEYTQKIIQVLEDQKNRYPNFDLIRNRKARSLIQRMLDKNPARRPELAEAAAEFHRIFLEGVTDEQAEQYKDFLTLAHHERKLPVPLQLKSFGDVTAAKDPSSQKGISFTRSVLELGGEEPMEHDPAMPEVYVVGRGGRPVRLTPSVRLQRWLKKNPAVTGTLAAAGALILLASGYMAIASKLPWNKRQQSSGNTELVDAGSQQNVVRITEPEFRSILREVAPNEVAELLDIEHDESGAISKIDLLGMAIDGENIYQFAGHTAPEQAENSPPDCRFGLCYLSEEDLAKLLGVSVEQLPDDLKLKNVAAMQNADGTERKTQVSGSYAAIYEIGGNQYAVVQGVGVLTRRGGEVHIYSSLQQVIASQEGKGATVHGHETVQDALTEGYKAASAIADFPARMEPLSNVDNFKYMPTSTMPTEMWAQNTLRTHKRGVQRALGIAQNQRGAPARAGSQR